MRFLRGKSPAPQHRTALNDGVRIHYEVRGRGRVLVLHHAFGGSGKSWHDAGYVARLEDRFRLVIIDGRGHGKSDKPHDSEAYGIENRIGDIEAVFDDADLDPAMYWGYSMGAWLGAAYVLHAPRRVSRFVSGAAAAAPSDAYPDETRRRIEAFRSGDVARIARDALMPAEVAKRLVEYNDMLALAALQEATLGWTGHDVSSIRIPVLYYAGEHDELLAASRDAAEATPGARLEVIPDSDHLTAFLRSHEVLQVVRPFLDAR